ncbi:MAG TPA: MFS transporter [Dermatophilaceae bacterium]|nr:MFS transporter [Dermatophilaceae bacterium]
MPDQFRPPSALPSALTGVLQARTAVYAAFALAGVQFAAFASRIPEVKAALNLSASDLGLTLLAISVGSLVALPTSGWLVQRFGASRTVAAGMVMAIVGLSLAGIGADLWHSRAILSVGLTLAGLGIGSWDVAMNIEGAAVEQQLGRSIMPRFHAAFSAGTVLSALLGAALSAGGIPIVLHLVATGVAVGLIGSWSVGRFLPRTAEDADHVPSGMADPAASAPVSMRGAWTEPRTLLIGFVTLAAAFTEGTANDWLSVAFVEGHSQPPWAGVLGLATFLIFMTIGRVAGTWMLDRYGRVLVLRITLSLAVVGALMVVFGSTPVAYAGAACWGIGSSLGFPLGMSAAADDPVHAAARVSVVSTIGYLAFLAGPPLLGFLGDHVGVLRALLVVGAMVALALLGVPAMREPQRSTAHDADPA